MLQYVLQKYDVKAWSEFFWFRIGTDGGLLWTRYWTFDSYNVTGNSWLAEKLLASQEELCCLVLNNYLLNYGLRLHALPVHVTVLHLQVRAFIHLVTFSFLELIPLLLRIRFCYSLLFIITSENYESFLYFQLYVRIRWRRNQPNSKSPVVLRTEIEDKVYYSTEIEDKVYYNPESLDKVFYSLPTGIIESC